MVKKLQGPKARTAILITLIVTALAEVIFRALVLKEASLGISNAGEQVTVIVFSAIILLFMAKKNDKIAYISCGALIAYFVMDQLFELPGMIANFAANISISYIAISIAIRLLTMVGIVVIAVLLAEYVNDGSIYNRAFNVTFWLTIILHVASIAFCITPLLLSGSSAEASNVQQLVLIVFNDVYRTIMVILFTSFAYDSANRQLKRENLAK